MTKTSLQRILWKANVHNLWETRIFVLSKNDIIYVQIGDGSQLMDDDVDEDGKKCDGYLDYKISSWNEEGSYFEEGDGGILTYAKDKGEDALYGELYTRMYDLLLYLYEDAVKEEGFDVQVLH